MFKICLFECEVVAYLFPWVEGGNSRHAVEKYQSTTVAGCVSTAMVRL